jgi:hypothetical protein
MMHICHELQIKIKLDFVKQKKKKIKVYGLSTQTTYALTLIVVVGAANGVTCHPVGGVVVVPPTGLFSLMNWIVPALISYPPPVAQSPALQFAVSVAPVGPMVGLLAVFT